jgi:hypothetical protein
MNVMHPNLHPLNLLRRVTADQLCLDPYPHLIIENALDEEVYAALESTYPADTIIRNARHVANRDQIQAPELLACEAIAPLWKQFAEFHISAAFYRELLRVFATSVRKMYPWLEQEKGYAFERFTTGVRDSKAVTLPDVCLDFQPGLNAVTQTPSSPRSPHLDANNKLFTGLFYMRHAGDTSRGGDFALYRPKTKPVPFETPVTVAEKHLEVVKLAPYARNTAVFFLNTPWALHGVTVRDATPIPRRLVNLVAGLYTLKNKVLYPTHQVSAA